MYSYELYASAVPAITDRQKHKHLDATGQSLYASSPTGAKA